MEKCIYSKTYRYHYRWSYHAQHYVEFHSYLSSWNLSDWSSARSRPFFVALFSFGTARIIERELRNEMFSHLETMDVEYYNSHKTGDLMTRFTSDLNAVRMALGPAVICIFDSVVMTILVVCQMMKVSNKSRYWH